MELMVESVATVNEVSVSTDVYKLEVPTQKRRMGVVPNPMKVSVTVFKALFWGADMQLLSHSQTWLFCKMLVVTNFEKQTYPFGDILYTPSVWVPDIIELQLHNICIIL